MDAVGISLKVWAREQAKEEEKNQKCYERRWRLRLLGVESAGLEREGVEVHLY